jgi:hypothetical protein
MMTERIDRHYIRLLLLALVIHSYHDWGLWGQIGIPLAALAFSIFYAWREDCDRKMVQS